VHQLTSRVACPRRQYPGWTAKEESLMRPTRYLNCVNLYTLFIAAWIGVPLLGRRSLFLILLGCYATLISAQVAEGCMDIGGIDTCL
jgi:hypothetical protein